MNKGWAVVQIKNMCGNEDYRGSSVWKDFDYPMGQKMIFEAPDVSKLTPDFEHIWFNIHPNTALSYQLIPGAGESPSITRLNGVESILCERCGKTAEGHGLLRSRPNSEGDFYAQNIDKPKIIHINLASTVNDPYTYISAGQQLPDLIPMTVCPGDWVIITSPGTYHVMSEKDYRAKFGGQP